MLNHLNMTRSLFMCMRRTNFFKKTAGISWSLFHLLIPRREWLGLWMEPTPWARLGVVFFALFPLFVTAIALRPRAFGAPEFRSHLLFCLVWFVVTFLPFSLRAMGENWREYPQPRYLYWSLMALSFLLGKVGEVLQGATEALKKKSFQRMAYGTLILAGIYFYGLNVWTYTFMVERLCQTACSSGY